MTKLIVEINVRAVTALAGRLHGLSGNQLGEAMVLAVNQVMVRTYDIARSRMTASLNLDDAYVTSRMQLLPANSSSMPIAKIVARGAVTTLGHYRPRMLLQAVKHPGRSKGNSALNIPKGMKPAGLSVSVTKGSAKTLTTGFQIPKFRDSEGNALVFLRGSNKKIRAAIGPSVYQLFRTQIAQTIDAVADDLESTIVNQANATMQDLLK